MLLLFFFPNSIKDKNKGELIPPVMKETVSYLKRKGEFCVKRGCVFQNKDNSMKLYNVKCLLLHLYPENLSGSWALP